MDNKYKVIALSVGGRFNKIYNSGDVVKSTDFHPGHVADLVNKGFLTLAPTEELEEVLLPPPAPTELKISAITAKEIKKQLTDLGIEFDKDSSKDELFALLPRSL